MSPSRVSRRMNSTGLPPIPPPALIWSLARVMASYKGCPSGPDRGRRTPIYTGSVSARTGDEQRMKVKKSRTYENPDNIPDILFICSPVVYHIVLQAIQIKSLFRTTIDELSDQRKREKRSMGSIPHRAMALYCPLSSSGVTTTLTIRLLPSAVCFGE